MKITSYFLDIGQSFKNSIAGTWLHDNANVIFRILSVSLLIYFLLPNALYYIAGAGMDPSWQIALHLAFKNGMVYGKDIMFTYGPLGVLSTRYSIGVSPFIYILFYLYILLNLGYIFNYALKQNNKVATLAVSLLMVIHIQNFYDRDISIALSCIFLFMIFIYLKNNKLIFLINALFLASLIFLIKISLGVVVAFITTSFFIYLILVKVLTLKKAAIIIGIFLLYFALMCLILRVNLYNYLVGSFYLISGYNAAMVVPQPITEPRTVAALTILFFFFALMIRSFRTIGRDHKSLFVFGATSLMLFVFFKNGFIRDHSNNFFVFIPWIFGLLYLFSDELKGRIQYVVLLSLLAGYLATSGLGTIFNTGLFRHPGQLASHYPEQLQKYRSDTVNTDLAASAKIPPVILKTIGRQSVDVIPEEISYIYFNNLDYNPRPVIQSYAAYNAYLDQLNADKYLSATAPDFVLFKQYSFEGRNPLYDETKTKLALLQNFEVTNSEWSYLLLKKLKSPVRSNIIRSEEVHGNLFKEISIKDSEELQILYADINYSLKGKLMNFFFEPALLFAHITLEDGTEFNHRIATSILKGGIIVNRHFPVAEDVVDLELFINFYGRRNSRVKFVKFYTDSPWAFKSDFDYKIEYVSFDSVVKGPSTGSAISAPLNKTLPPAIGGNQHYNVENITQSNNSVFIAGWSYIPQIKTDLRLYAVMAANGKKPLVFPLMSQYRPDVATYFSRPDIDSCGFSALIRREFLAPGSYQIGLLAESKDSSFFEMIGKSLLITDHKKYTSEIKKQWIQDSIVFNIENIKEEKMRFNVQGWAYLSKGDNSQTAVSLVVEKDQQIRIYQTFPKDRPDVKAAFSRNDILHCGFSFDIPKSQLTKGAHKMGILISQGDRQVYRPVSNKVISKK